MSIKGEKVQEQLPVMLTDDEKLEFGRRVGQIHAELVEVQDYLDEAKTSAKHQREKLENERGSLSLALATGQQIVTVECQWEIDREEGEGRLVRLDTGEVVRTRKLSNHERQAHISDARL